MQGNTFIPILTSTSGSCLTAEQWQEAKVSAVSYSLESLLYKPGQEVLKNITSLSDYLSWSGIIILNAASLVTNKRGIYALKSPYDGSIINSTCSELIELIQHLKPNAVILPKNSIHDFLHRDDMWHDSIRLFIHAGDLENYPIRQSHGVYFNGITELNTKQLERWSHVLRYVMGHFNPKLMQQLCHEGIDFIETDEPANAALQGRVYSKSGTVDLTAEETRMQFELIAADCTCPTCAQQLTRAYLHHLLQHTPLLCHRFLIQHNVFYYASLGSGDPQIGNTILSD